MSGEPGVIDVLDDEKHREQRQLFNQGFSTRALKEQESLLRKHVDRLVAAVQSRADQGLETNMVDMFNFLAFDVMGDLAFGASLGLLERSEYNNWVRVIVATIKIVTVRIVVFYHIPFAPQILPLLVPKSMKAKRDAHMKFAEDRVRERLERKTDRPDLWGLITGGPDGKKAHLSLDQMVGNAALFMVVGSETTATVLSGTLYLLLKNKNCMERLRKEIFDNFSSKKDMTIEALPKLTYMTAVLDEAMRVYPGAPETLARLVPAGGMQICGEYVPQGATVFILHYPTFHSSRNFVRPDDFAPERWLPEGAVEFEKDDKKAFNPFSVGPRACLGRKVAKRVEVARRYTVQSGKNVLGIAQRGRRQFAVKHPSNPTTFGHLGTRHSLSELVLSTCLGCVESPMSEYGGCSAKRRVVASSRHCVTTSSHCRIVFKEYRKADPSAFESKVDIQSHQSWYHYSKEIN
ncbi:cytochrome p450 [Alternaria alternata]|nr:cytochrome p450 [Alternaria alternata]